MLSFFPLDVLDEICDVIESVSEGFLTNSCIVHLIIRGHSIVLCFHGKLRNLKLGNMVHLHIFRTMGNIFREFLV